MTKLIDGKAISARLREDIKEKTNKFNAKFGRVPGLAVIIVGEDPASQTYVKNKVVGCEQVGFKSMHFELPADSTQEEVENLVEKLAKDESMDGILVQLPLPKHLDEKKILAKIPDEKDVDGFSPNNLGLLAMGAPRTVSCTPYGIMKLFEYEGIDLSGKNAVVIGRSNTVGKPMAMLLMNANCTVTVCHSRTKDISAHTKEADIVVVAIGKPNFLTADMIKQDAIVIDVGINRVDGKLCGDVDFENVSKKTSYITPVPGGVGPMTISMLLYNTLETAIQKETSK